MKTTAPTIKVLKSGERVIVDPEATTERAVLWFYLLINVGGFMAVPTSYSEKYVGWALAFGIPLFLWVLLPLALFYVKKRLVLYPPGGSDLVNCFRVLGLALRKGMFKIGRNNFWESAKPSVIVANGGEANVPWNDGQ